MRKVDLPTPHFTDRVSDAQMLVADHDRTPELADADRAFLAGALERLRRAVSESGRPEQLLHGEPHPGNLLSTQAGPLFIDFETCCRGSIDLAHAPDEVGDHYPGVDRHLLRDCRTLVLAMVTMWRWDRDDHFPDGPRLGCPVLAPRWRTQPACDRVLRPRHWARPKVSNTYAVGELGAGQARPLSARVTAGG
jgi:hypothetical protein